MTGYNIFIYNSPEILALKATEDLADAVLSYSKKQKKINICLSGGNTPTIFFKILSKMYHHLPWQLVHFYWGDERCVSPEDEESNFYHAKKYLFDKINIPEKNIHRIFGENDPETEKKRYISELNSNLKKHNGIPVFDIIYLGMGDDGHTASIFPGQTNIFNSANICETVEHPTTKQKRITVTGKMIINSKNIIFLITGGSKAATVSSIIHKKKNLLSYPAALVMKKRPDTMLMLDKKATALL